MFSFLSVKDLVYVGIIIAMVATAWALVDSWHYKPIRVLKEERNSLKTLNKNKDIVINNLSIELVKAIENTKIKGFEEYFKGLADANITVTDKLIF